MKGRRGDSGWRLRTNKRGEKEEERRMKNIGEVKERRGEGKIRAEGK